MPVKEIQATQAAQQAVQQPKEGAAPKQGPSKFDDSMKARGASAPESVQSAQKLQQAQMTRGVEKAQSVEAARQEDRIRKDTSKKRTKVSSKSESSQVTSSIAKMLEDIEKGQGIMDKLIKSSAKGREFSNSELISLQAGMYKYTQELELTGKVVEKATSGLKDTLKTQV